MPATNPDASFSAQLIGKISVNTFIFIVAYIVWTIMKSTIGLRQSKEGEIKGTDVTETGVITLSFTSSMSIVLSNILEFATSSYI
ncbi:ammonium transporter [Candidatus Pelagibacter sp.]|nr:ammonium transporter [Candidatus Pelagibacter sp.]